ncbi:DUF2784 domain-containing protein [Aestuariivivens sediminicola]|uniref:DUF2784 domain-containing protein n=1 Tax=Aestuariivivens sediminicola TaxID=2913560 RepID=UPI001F583BAC|nr:DUF2784 domain-containing protein [Aestuariivivens sediminicola]
MPEPILRILDLFFFVFHTIVILFNVFGWLIPRWRLANLIVLSLTAFSWFILGIWYGWGYCFCTDWHWQVRELLGYSNMSTSYIHFLLLQLTGVDLSVSFVDSATVFIFIFSFAISSYLNVRKWTRK